MRNKRHVVFLHGFLGSPEMWKPIVDLLSKNQLHLHFPRLPGHDRRPLPANWHMDLWVDDVMEQLPLASREDAFFIGHSMGGYVLSRLAVRFPDKVRGLCLFHSRVAPDSEEKKDIRLRAMDAIRENSGRYVHGMVHSLFAEKHRIPLKREIDSMVEYGRGLPDNVLLASQQVMRERPDNTVDLQSRHFPLYYLLGEEDTALPPAILEEELGSLPGHTARIITDCAHMSHLEKPREAGSFIRRILQADV